MMKKPVFALCVAVGVCVSAPGWLLADWYDDFSDGSYWNDPNYEFNYFAGGPEYGGPGFDPNEWDMDNPYWSFYPLMCGGGLIECVSATGLPRPLMRIFSQAEPLVGQYAFLGAFVEDEDFDANTSATWWDDSTSHYIIARFLYPGAEPNPNDPREDRGGAMLYMHMNLGNWHTFAFNVNLDDKIAPWVKFPNDPNYMTEQQYSDSFKHGWSWKPHEWGTHHVCINCCEGTDWRNFKRVWIDPNGCRAWNSSDPNTSDPNDTTWLAPPEKSGRVPAYDDPSWYGVDFDGMEREGFWMLLQFQLDPNHPDKPGDPNGKYLKGALWAGDKYDWNGAWTLEGELSSTWWGNENQLQWYSQTTVGITGVAATSDVEYLNGPPAEIAVGDFEARVGLFTNVWRTLTVKMKDCSSLNLEPNVAHPDGGEKRRYTEGTPVVLDAVVPVGNKVFKKWTIKGPNQSDDPNYLIVSDTNEVVYVTMDGDYLVKATCKCGGGGIEPFAGMVLLVLGLGVIVRRLT